MNIFQKSAFFLLMVFIACALSGYWITLDKTKYCNAQVLEISFLKPLQKACFKSTQHTEETNILSIWINGINNFEKQILAERNDSNQICKTFFLGTDRFGRDLLSRIIIGIRYTLLVSLLAVAFAVIIGTILGSVAGFFGGKADLVINFIIGIFWAIPTILLAFVILMTMGRNIASIMISIGLTMWADIARLVRGLVMTQKENYYVLASKAIGNSPFKILFKEILPNMGGPILVQASSSFALAVLLESGLSFLGLGLQAPIPTLGNILQDQYTQAFNGQIMQSLIPAIVLVLLILSFQLTSGLLRDKYDVKLKVK